MHWVSIFIFRKTGSKPFVKVWPLRNDGIPGSIPWKANENLSPYINWLKRCKLCITEPGNIIKSRIEMFGSCLHFRRYLMAHCSSENSDTVGCQWPIAKADNLRLLILCSDVFPPHYIAQRLWTNRLVGILLYSKKLNLL